MVVNFMVVIEPAGRTPPGRRLDVNRRFRRGIAEVPAGRSTTHHWAGIHEVDVDLTWRQFPPGTAIRDIEVIEVIERDVILANRWIIGRYAELCANFAHHRAGRSLQRWNGGSAVRSAVPAQASSVLLPT
jgi:hypothetical protein